MHRFWGIRHIRYWWLRRQFERHLAECYRIGIGIHPARSDLDFLDAVWRGEI